MESRESGAGHVGKPEFRIACRCCCRYKALKLVQGVVAGFDPATPIQHFDGLFRFSDFLSVFGSRPLPWPSPQERGGGMRSFVFLTLDSRLSTLDSRLSTPDSLTLRLVDSTTYPGRRNMLRLYVSPSMTLDSRLSTLDL